MLARGSVLVEREDPTARGRHAERREIGGGHERYVRPFAGSARSIDVERGDAARRTQVREDLGVLLKRPEHRIQTAGPDRYQRLRIPNGQGVEQNGVDQAEDGCRTSDAECQRQYRDGGEARRLAQAAGGNTDVLPDAVDDRFPADVSDFFPHDRGRPERYASGPSRRLMAHPASNPVLDSAFEKVLQLSVQLTIAAAGPTQCLCRSDEAPDPRPHNSPSEALRILAIAVV